MCIYIRQYYCRAESAAGFTGVKLNIHTHTHIAIYSLYFPRVSRNVAARESQVVRENKRASFGRVHVYI